MEFPTSTCSLFSIWFSQIRALWFPIVVNFINFAWSCVAILWILRAGTFNATQKVQLIIQVQSDAALAVRNSAVRRFRGQTLNVICSSEFQHVRTTMLRKKPWGRKRCVLQFRWWITRSRLERYPGGSSSCSRFLMCNSEAVPSDLRPDFVIERSTNVCVASWSPRGQWQW